MIERILAVMILLFALNRAVSAGDVFCYIESANDGDGVRVTLLTGTHDGKTNQVRRCRLGGIDAPEIDQKCGEWSLEQLRKMCVQHYSFVVFDGQGFFNRWIIYIGNVNYKMVAAGAAHPTDDAPPSFKAAARKAIKRKRGIWKDEFVVHPKEWRDAKKENRKPKALPRKHYIERYA